jgi:ribosome biogenesis GTPase / thiamine phosphate phosphatase
LIKLLEGLVVKELSGFFWVEASDGLVYRCRIRGRLMEQAQSSDIAAIGDRVKISVIEGEGRTDEAPDERDLRWETEAEDAADLVETPASELESPAAEAAPIVESAPPPSDQAAPPEQPAAETSPAVETTTQAANGQPITSTPAPVLEGMIEAVKERESVLSRSARTEGNRGAGAAEREHVIVANAEQALFVFAASQPKPSLKLLDRFLVAGEKSGIGELVIVVNKIDLEDAAVIERDFRMYEEIGYRVLRTSAVTGEGVEELRQRMKDRISVFTGPSGVGKTSLLNTIQPGLGRTVRAVSIAAHHEGTHTTRDSELVKLTVGGYLADTPGLRSLSVWDVEPEELDAYFVEIAPLVEQCKFGDCTHINEPGCAVRKAVERGKIDKRRYDSYLKLRGDLEAAISY